MIRAIPIAVWIAILTVGALGAAVFANSLRFRRGVTSEVEQLFRGAAGARLVDPNSLQNLPDPVRRYAGKALAGRSLAVRTVRLRHGGTFRTKLDGRWLPIRGKQYFSADPPGFVWWGRARVAPGLWVDARDRSVGGVGNMCISVESSLTVAVRSGTAMDQGALLRLLGEMAWFPTALLDDRFVTWTAVDDSRARATLRLSGREVTGLYEFREDLPGTFRADRYRDLDGKSVLTPWSGEFGDYRRIEGLLVPHRMVGNWHVDGQTIPYARFQVERLEYDRSNAF